MKILKLQYDGYSLNISLIAIFHYFSLFIYFSNFIYFAFNPISHVYSHIPFRACIIQKLFSSQSFQQMLLPFTSGLVCASMLTNNTKRRNKNACENKCCFSSNSPSLINRTFPLIINIKLRAHVTRL